MYFKHRLFVYILTCFCRYWCSRFRPQKVGFFLSFLVWLEKLLVFFEQKLAWIKPNQHERTQFTCKIIVFEETHWTTDRQVSFHVSDFGIKDKVSQKIIREWISLVLLPDEIVSWAKLAFASWCWVTFPLKTLLSPLFKFTTTMSPNLIGSIGNFSCISSVYQSKLGIEIRFYSFY